MAEDAPITAYVLWHRFGDGSAASVHRVYFDKERAYHDLDLCATAGSESEWHVDSVPVYGDYP